MASTKTINREASSYGPPIVSPPIVSNSFTGHDAGGIIVQPVMAPAIIGAQTNYHGMKLATMEMFSAFFITLGILSIIVQVSYRKSMYFILDFP